MTLNQAFEELIQSPDYRDIAKVKDSKGGKYRVYMARFKAGKLKAGAIAEMLIEHGYEVRAKWVTRRKPAGG